MKRRIKQFIASLYIQNRFFYGCLAIFACFVISYIYPKFFLITKLLLLVLLAFAVLDILILYTTSSAIRDSPCTKESTISLNTDDDALLDGCPQNYTNIHTLNIHSPVQLLHTNRTPVPSLSEDQ